MVTAAVLASAWLGMPSRALADTYTFPGTSTPLYYETSPSTLRGADGSITTKGFMLVIHGGGWKEVGKHKVDEMDWWTLRYNAIGWATTNVDYRAGRDSLTDVIGWYDLMDEAVGEGRPVCAMGISAGGHLGLLLAINRRSLDCVIAQGAPTDLEHWNDPSTPTTDQARDNAETVFGKGNLTTVSPLTYAGDPHNMLTAPLLLANVVDDTVVPIEQQRRLAAKRPDAVSLELPTATPGDSHAFSHSRTTYDGVADYLEREDTFLGGVAGAFP